MDHADHQRPWRMHQLQRLRYPTQRQQHIVEDTVVRQYPLPCINAQQERGPERQHHQHQQQRPVGRPGARHAIGERIADQQAQQRGAGGVLQRAQVGQQIQLVADDEQVIRPCQCQHAIGVRHRAVHLDQTDAQYDQEWQQESADQPGQRQADHPVAALDPARPRQTTRQAGRHLQLASSMMSAPSHQTNTRCPRTRRTLSWRAALVRTTLTSTPPSSSTW